MIRPCDGNRSNVVKNVLIYLATYATPPLRNYDFTLVNQNASLSPLSLLRGSIHLLPFMASADCSTELHPSRVVARLVLISLATGYETTYSRSSHVPLLRGSAIPWIKYGGAPWNHFVNSTPNSYV